MNAIADAEARIGKRIGGKYLLHRVLGSGGMGAVFYGENTWLKRPVAVKVLHPDLAGNSEVVERFLQEAQTASQLRHPNIVDVLDLGQDPRDDALYIVQEYLDGKDLRATLDARGRLSADEAVDIVLPLMGALSVAHRRGIVHRDLKPENVFLMRNEFGEVTPKLIDFGISKVLIEDHNQRNLTQAGTIVGTPNYMSPEQARGEVSLDGRSDVWSLGVVLYEMLAGRCPFDAPNQNVLMVKIITEDAPRIEGFAPEVPMDLADVLHMALVNRRDDRFADMDAFIAAMAQTALGAALVERHRRSLMTVAGLGDRPPAESRPPARHADPVMAPWAPPQPFEATTQVQPATPVPAAVWERWPSRTADGDEASTRVHAPPSRPSEMATTQGEEAEPRRVVDTPVGWSSTRVPSGVTLPPPEPPPRRTFSSALPWMLIVVFFGLALGVGTAIVGIGSAIRRPASTATVTTPPVISPLPVAVVPPPPTPTVAAPAALAVHEPILDAAHPRSAPTARPAGTSTVRRPASAVRPMPGMAPMRPVVPVRSGAPARPATPVPTAPRRPRNGAPIITL
ncbi:MAG: protein kinase [Deltaproteobacteria bacterium]|nr:protein kinase [Deltaproteobacteria bacterium]